MIPVNEPVLSANSKKYVNDCLNTGWISSAGSYIEKFETAFAQYIGTTYAVTTSNGTTALHLALASLGISKGDEVIIPDLTIISCVAAIIYTGATPVVVDVDPIHGNIDPIKLKKAITKKTKAIMPVHLYGQPVDMDPIMEIAKKYSLTVIEDAAEAHGAFYKGKMVGGIGNIGCYSFYANKLITCGEGGMIVTNDKNVYEKAQLLKNLAHSPKKRFYHEEIGYNYRLTNLQAAIGFGELEQAEKYIEKKRLMATMYNTGLGNIPFLELPKEEGWAKNSYWMYSLLVTKNSPITRDELRIKLKERGVDTRDYFYPIHSQPAVTKLGFCTNVSCPVSDDLSSRGFYLPSGLALTETHMQEVISAVHACFAP